MEYTNKKQDIDFQAGDLNIQISIQAKSGAKDSFGQSGDTWSDIVTDVWASIQETGGREFYAAQKSYAETTALFKVSFVNGIRTTMRIKFGTRYFNILGVNNIKQKNICLLLAAKEAV